MKKIALIALLVATPALAQELDVDKLDAARKAAIEKSQAEKGAAVDAAAVDGVVLRFSMKQDPAQRRGRPERDLSVMIGANDPEFAAVLAAAKAAFARKAGKAASDLEATGVAVPLKAAPAEPAPQK